MAETAAHLVDHVIPEVPVRQWVLSMPIDMRYWLSSNPKLTTPVLKKIIRVIEMCSLALCAPNNCKIISAIQGKKAITKILCHLNLPTETPQPHEARRLKSPKKLKTEAQNHTNQSKTSHDIHEIAFECLMLHQLLRQ